AELFSGIWWDAARRAGSGILGQLLAARTAIHRSILPFAIPRLKSLDSIAKPFRKSTVGRLP
ncbi:MAG: hypothetical protein AB7O62_16985, partial [Pirellulales bacterium]